MSSVGFCDWGSLRDRFDCSVTLSLTLTHPLRTISHHGLAGLCWTDSFGCLVHRVLLVLSICRSAEAGAFISGIVNRAGHKLVQATSCEQGKTLLHNGVEPDLVIFDASNLGADYGLSEMVYAAAQAPVCLICGPRDHRIRNKAAKLGVTRFLEIPLREKDVVELLEGERSTDCELRAF